MNKPIVEKTELGCNETVTLRKAEELTGELPEKEPVCSKKADDENNSVEPT
jgi:hypothetical protein